jgi:alanine dehydrogenase
LAGLNVAGGEVTYAPVAADQGLAALDPLDALAKLAVAA